MHRRHLLALSGALAAGTLGGCTSELRADGGSPARAAPGPEPDVEDEQLRELVHQTNGFAFDLFRELLDDGGNLFASPVSVSLALAMAYAGARDETRSQMSETLRYTLADDALHEAFEALQRELDSRGAGEEEPEQQATGAQAGNAQGADDAETEDEPVPFELTIANAVWGQADYPFEEPYLETLADHYGGGLREVEYRAEPESARRAINEWVADQTEERITDLLPEGAVDELTRLVLANAVYFLANWQHPFPEAQTSQATFTALDGTDHEVPMMRENRSWQYATVDGAQAVELPYVGGDVSMLVVLPPAGEFESYERALDGETVAGLVDALASREGSVQLPRFEFDAGFQLRSVLARMGMPDAFDPEEADFSGVADFEATGEPLFVDDVYHEAYVAVDEAGTEAAAATGVVMGTTSVPTDPFEFVADRPFLFCIRDRPTETILFLGRVVDPGEWE